MGKTLFIDPPSLLRWLPREQQNNQALFLDLEPDVLDEHTLRLDLNVVFRPIPIKRGLFQIRDYYVGSTGARITFEAFLGRVTKYTVGTTLKVDYENSYTHSRKNSVKIAPTIEAGEELKAGIGEVTLDKNVERVFTSKFSGAEKMLAHAELGQTGVLWELKLPDGQAIRDYLIGNLYLFVESSWADLAKEGRIEVRPSDVLFFGADRRKIASGIKALAMRYALWKRGLRLNHESIVITFREGRSR